MKPPSLPFEVVASFGTPADHARRKALRSILETEDPINLQFTSSHDGTP